MAKKFTTAIHLNQNELQFAALQGLSAAPTTPVTGQLFYHTTDQAIWVKRSTGWEAVSFAHTHPYASDTHPAVVASASVLGHIKIGSGLAIDGTGVVSVTVGGATINNNAATRVVTGSDTAGTLNAEALMTFVPSGASGTGVLTIGSLATINGLGQFSGTYVGVNAATGTGGNIFLGGSGTGNLYGTLVIAGSKDGGTIHDSDTMGMIVFRGQQGVGYMNGVEIIATAEDTFSASLAGTSLVFKTTVEGYMTPSTRMEFTRYGTIRFNGQYAFPGGSGSTGQVLRQSSTVGILEWATLAAGLTIGGSDTHVQYNSGGALAGSGNFTWTNGTNTLYAAISSSGLFKAVAGADGLGSLTALGLSLAYTKYATKAYFTVATNSASTTSHVQLNFGLTDVGSPGTTDFPFLKAVYASGAYSVQLGDSVGYFEVPTSIYSQGVEVMHIDPYGTVAVAIAGDTSITGNLVIGTASPSARVHLYQNTNNDLSLLMQNAYGGKGCYNILNAQSYYAAVVLETISGGVAQAWQFGQSGTANFTLYNTTLTKTALTVLASNDYVGIGGTPSYPLHLVTSATGTAFAIETTHTTTGRTGFLLKTGYTANAGDYFLFNFRGDNPDVVQSIYDASAAAFYQLLAFKYLASPQILQFGNPLVATFDFTNKRLGMASVLAPTASISLEAATAAAGGIAFGTDTNLYRSAADVLKTDDALVVGGSVTCLSSVVWYDSVTLRNKADSGTVAFYTRNVAGSEVVADLFNLGTLQWGGDTNLYRSAASLLMTDDDFKSDRSITANTHLQCAKDAGLYIGTKDSNGSWLIITSGADLIIQKHNGTSYVTKQTITG
jgi:hypothetical protein